MEMERSSSSNERTRILERLVDFNCCLCSSLDLEPFLHSLIAAASELTGSEAASILEPDEDEEQFRFLALPWFHREALKTVKVPLKQSVAGWVFENGESLIVMDAAAEPRHFKGVDRLSAFVTHSILAVPISYQGQKLGVMEVINKIGGDHYTEEDKSVLENLACQAAVAIQNTHLMNRVQQTEEAMAELNRMKSDFIGIASHELRSPLGLILGHATFLRESISPELQPQLDTIIRNSFRMKEIIDSIARMDDVQRGVADMRARPVAIREVIAEVMDSFRPEAAAKHISLMADPGPEDLLVQGDAFKISIALSNLVQNALIFSNPDGHVLISAEQIPGYVKVSVTDDGIGIPVKDLPHIFERFYQVEAHLNRKHGGMGLGLSVAKVMIEMHGGRIWVESLENKGSNFTFILPISASEQEAADRGLP
jgi:signal transduction histidine kinase